MCVATVGMLFLTADGSVCEAGVGASSLVTAQLLAKLSVMTKNKHARVTFMYDKFNMRDPKRINTPKNRCTTTTNQK